MRKVAAMVLFHIAVDTWMIYEKTNAIALWHMRD